MKLFLLKPDTLGAVASTLCLLHCLATPLLFIAHASSAGVHETAPLWWKSIDYLFLIISFFAIYRSTQNTTKNFMKPALWISWVALFTTIINERLGWFTIPEITIYTIATILAVLHLYNLKYCQCKEKNCCNTNE